MIRFMIVGNIRWGKSNHPMFFCCYFLMKNFGSACEMYLFNLLQILFVYFTNVKTELAFGAICKSYSVFQYGDYFWPTLYDI